MMKFCKNLAGPCPAPTYLPTYLTYGKLKKKTLDGRERERERDVC